MNEVRWDVSSLAQVTVIMQNAYPYCMGPFFFLVVWINAPPNGSFISLTVCSAIIKSDSHSTLPPPFNINNLWNYTYCQGVNFDWIVVSREKIIIKTPSRNNKTCQKFLMNPLSIHTYFATLSYYFLVTQYFCTTNSLCQTCLQQQIGRYKLPKHEWCKSYNSK